MDKPFLYPFAKDGDRNTELPNANAIDDSVSFQSGFTLPYELNPATGGKNLERKDMNEILFRICGSINNVSQEVDKWIALTTENLNDIQAKGRYFQSIKGYAGVDKNYPISECGYLTVFDSVKNYPVQFYKTIKTNKTFTRAKNEQSWSAWVEIADFDMVKRNIPLPFVFLEEWGVFKNSKVVKLPNRLKYKRVAVFMIFRALGIPRDGTTKTLVVRLRNADTGETGSEFRFYVTGASDLTGYAFSFFSFNKNTNPTIILERVEGEELLGRDLVVFSHFFDGDDYDKNF